MSPIRRCEHCHEPLICTARSDARYCSVRCRVAALRSRHADDPVPAALRSRARWVRHDAKRPIQVDGRAASSTDPRTWTTYENASASAIGDGLGFVLDGDGIVCVDLDHCLDGRQVAPWAQRVLAQLPATYIEVSPSGTGLHVWGTGSVVRGRVLRLEGGVVELYGRGRYLTVTERRYHGAPSRIADLGAFIAAITH